MDIIKIESLKELIIGFQWWIISLKKYKYIQLIKWKYRDSSLLKKWINKKTNNICRIIYFFKDDKYI